MPLFGIALAAITVGQLPEAVELPAIALMVLGALRRRLARRGRAAGARSPTRCPRSACALCWALSPALTVRGLDGLDDPLARPHARAAASPSSATCSRSRSRGAASGCARAGRSALALKLVAGVLVGLSTWGRWAALDRTTVAVVLALNLLSIPVVLLASPLVAGRHAEHVTGRVWAGAALVVSGSLLLIVAA